MNATPMHEWTERLAGGLMTAEDDLAREFDTRLVECAPLAFRVAFSVLRHRQDAEDVAQEAFTRAHRSFRQLREADSFRSWLVRMVWRMSLDRRRADRRRQFREAEHGSFERPDAEQAMVARQRAEIVWEAIDALPDRLRLTLVLAGIEGHDIKEVSRLLGIPVGTVKSRLFHARQQLKERLQCTNSSMR
jgi:RNA polymerase sigma-70 factor (ECF subfamily)